MNYSFIFVLDVAWISCWSLLGSYEVHFIDFLLLERYWASEWSTAASYLCYSPALCVWLRCKTIWKRWASPRPLFPSVSAQTFLLSRPSFLISLHRLIAAALHCVLGFQSPLLCLLIFPECVYTRRMWVCVCVSALFVLSERAFVHVWVWKKCLEFTNQARWKLNAGSMWQNHGRSEGISSV